MSKQQSKEKVIVTSHDVEQDLQIRKVEETDKDLLKVQGELVDITYKKIKDIDDEIAIKPDVNELAKKTDLSVKKVKECVGELHKQQWLRDGKEEGSIKVDQFKAIVLPKGHTVCIYCGQVMDFDNETITDKWGKVDPEGTYINYRYRCKNPQCKHEATADFRVQAKRV